MSARLWRDPCSGDGAGEGVRGSNAPGTHSTCTAVALTAHTTASSCQPRCTKSSPRAPLARPACLQWSRAPPPAGHPRAATPTPPQPTHAKQEHKPHGAVSPDNSMHPPRAVTAIGEWLLAFEWTLWRRARHVCMTRCPLSCAGRRGRRCGDHVLTASAPFVAWALLGKAVRLLAAAYSLQCL